MRRLLVFVLAMLAFSLGRAADAPPAAQGPTLSGEVLEVREADARTYLRLKTWEGNVWAAVPTAPVKKGSRVTIENLKLVTNFESKALRRKFDRIVFGRIAWPGTAPAAQDLNRVHGGLAQPPKAGDTKVAKAQGPDARTVAEVHGAKALLKDKPATVRGKVVKFTPNVMGRNWVHLRDGTGKPADKSDDLVVTTREMAQVGATVVASGTIRTDVDLGFGYTYKVLLDEAKLGK